MLYVLVHIMVNWLLNKSEVSKELVLVVIIVVGIVGLGFCLIAQPPQAEAYSSVTTQ